MAVNHLSSHRHRDLLIGASHEQALNKQVTHQDAHKHATVAAVGLLWAILELMESKWDAQDAT